MKQPPFKPPDLNRLIKATSTEYSFTKGMTKVLPQKNIWGTKSKTTLYSE